MTLGAILSTLLPFPVELLCFLASLGLTMAAAAWFTRRLEAICDRLELSAGVLSILGALGANIPNYVASIDAIARGETEVGLGIIIGSNIYNVAIILGLATFAAGRRKGLRFNSEEIRQIRDVGGYALAVLLATLLVVWLLPLRFTWTWPLASSLENWLMLAAALLALGLFAAFAWHILRRPHPEHIEKHAAEMIATRHRSLKRLALEATLTLALALAGVVVMVQSGQGLTTELHMAPALAGLLVLAVATSLPNTVVAIFLGRTGRASSCVEEIFSSNSINAALGIALPLLFWSQDIRNASLLLLDAPLMVLLTLLALLSARRGRITSFLGASLLLVYMLWVGVHLFI